MLKRTLCLGLIALAACSEAPPEPGSVAPAEQAERAEFGSNPGDRFKPAKDAAVKELLCMRALGVACPADIDERLAQYASEGSGSRIDLVDSFVVMRATQELGDAETTITDAAYVEACYNAILGRPSDEGGYSANLAFLKTSRARKALVESMLRSAEFRS